MSNNLPTQRLSPKNQMTLPRGVRSLAGAEDQGFVCALPHAMSLPDGSGRVPVVVLMTEGELASRERAIRENPELDGRTKERQIALLNGHVRQLAIDNSRRVVLPPHFVERLKLEREVYLFGSNDSVLVWNPADWIRYSDPVDADDADDGLLMI